MYRFDGSIALVTGGARGIGRVISTRLAEQGAHVIVNCFHSYDAAKQLRDELTGRGLAVEVVRASVAQRAQVERMFDTVADRHGRLDLLVNNAASGAFTTALQTTEEHVDRAMASNLKGSLLCAQRAYPLMRGRPGAAIVNLSSVGAGMTVGNYLSVGTAKAAVESLTRYLAVEFARDGIRVNTASGGLIEGDVAQLFPLADQMHEQVAASTPLGGLGRPEDLADVVLFLLSDAARWVTGQSLLADGGLSLGGRLLTPASLWEVGHRPSPAVASSEPTGASISAATGSTAASTSAATEPIAASTSAATEPIAVSAGAATEQIGTATGASVAAAVTTRSRSAPPADDPESSMIAVVGAGLVVPGADSPDEFWRVLTDGPDLLSDARPERLRVESFYSPDAGDEDKTYQTRCGYADGYRPHPWLAAELGSDPRSVEYGTQWLRHAVSDAIAGVRLPAGDRVSCVVGYTPDGNQHLEEALVVEGLLEDLDEAARCLGWQPARRAELLRRARLALADRYPLGHVPLGNLLPMQVGRGAVEGLLPPRSELVMVDTACSSALYALDIGIKGILEGKHDVAVCGGTFAVGPRNAVLFAKLHGLSRSGRVRPLDRECDGVLFSDGAAAVALKRLDAARRDGDTVLGYIGAIGTSSDGRGKAIYAPNVAGQRLAIERALAKLPGTARPDWVVAHATGTPAGDLCEITSIREVLPQTEPIYVTSNKALIGHTGWAAGVVSLIQVLQSLRREVILPQHRFTASPADYALDRSALRVPTGPVAWPAGPGPRTAAVSGFGFGGTNAHLVVQDRPLPHARPDGDEIVVTSWAAHLPGGFDERQTRAWLTGTGPAPPRGFGPAYDTTGLALRMPPRVLRTLDRCQLMVVRCAQQLRDALGEAWERHRPGTGVFVGHAGPTRHAVLYGRRCHLDNALEALEDLTGDVAVDDDLRAALRRRIRDAVPASNEDSFPGIMPNVIAARVSNYFGLNGPNMTIDLGFASTLGALEVAARYLRAGDVDVALVGGVNGNSTEVMRRVVAAVSGDDGVSLAEGAFMFAVTRRALAESYGLPVLAVVGDLRTGDDTPDDAARTVSCGGGSDRPGGPLYLGAEAAVALARVLAAQPSAASDSASASASQPAAEAGYSGASVRIVARERAGSPALSLRLRGLQPASSAPGVAPVQPASSAPGVAPVQPASPSSGAPTVQPESLAGAGATVWSASAGSLAPLSPPASPAVRRHVSRWAATMADAVRPAAAALPADAVIVTATPDLLGAVGTDPGDPLVLSVVPTSGARRRYLPELSEEAVGLALGEDLQRLRHVRVVTDLAALGAPETALDGDPATIFALQDAVFLTLKATEPALRAHGGSVLGLFTGGHRGLVQHPYAGLFSGLFKSAALELERNLVRCVLTDATALEPALDELVTESRATGYLPVAVYAGGVRHTMVTDEVPVVAGGNPPLDGSDVVVAVAGARGITAEVTKAIAARYRPVIYTIGSKPLAELSAQLERYSDGGLPSRAEFVRRELAGGETANGRQSSVKAINERYERLDAAARMLANLAEMRRWCGADRVRYLAADVLDEGALRVAFETVAAEHGRIDLLIHGAGINRASAIATKTLEQFRQVRAVKTQGYLNLRRALGSLSPRIWCNFSSLIGLTGQRGETDYAASNEFLATAAAVNRELHGRDEFTIGWTLWREVGMASSSVHQSFFSAGPMANVLTLMPTAEGTYHFLSELEAANRVAAVHHLGQTERAAVADIVPGYFTPRTPPPSRTGVADRGTFYLDTLVRHGPDRLTAERWFTPERDGYLRHHRVRGVPTLPGCFVAELAAEAANALLPELTVVGLRDLRFEHFLRLGGATGRSPRRIVAEVRDREQGQAIVDVRVVGDVVSPGGVVLQRDRPHFAASVVLADRYPPAPRVRPWPGAPEQEILDPYHAAGSSVALTGPFVTTAGTRLHPLGKRARYTAPVGRDSVFRRFLVPALLLDGLIRLAVLDLVAGRYVPVAAPTAIRRIDLYAPDNDVDLAARGVPIDLSVTPRGLLVDESASASRYLATLPGGQVLVQVKDVQGVVTGYIDATNGRPLDASAVEGAALGVPAVEGSALGVPAVEGAVPGVSPVGRDVAAPVLASNGSRPRLDATGVIAL